MADDYGDDEDFSAALADTPQQTASSKSNGAAPSSSRVQQPKPQALPSRSGPSSILVSPRQKGNPILNSIRALPWEYSDTPADYVLGTTTCALFLSLKYHRLHPEYIYNRIRGLAGKYNLRIILTMVDIDNHDEPLRELSKTSIINNVTIILCWSAQEAGRYLELFKSYENAAPTSIKAHQSTSYSDKLVEFITVPRSINKTDAVGLVSSFGSIRTAVSARPEEVALVDGWGEKKVQRWCNTVREPFRVKKAARRGLSTENSRATISREASRAEAAGEPIHDPGRDARLGLASSVPEGFLSEIEPGSNSGANTSTDVLVADMREPDEDEELAFQEVTGQILPSQPPGQQKRKADNELSAGISAHLEKLRRGGV